MVTRRMNRIFRPDGRTLIVAMDHGLIDGPCKGLEHPGETINKIVAGGADAILTSYGVAYQFAKELAPLGLILRVDGGVSSIGGAPGGTGILIAKVEDALRLGADAVVVSGYPGALNEAESLERIAMVAHEAHTWGIAMLAEMVPGGFDSKPEYRSVKNIALASRLGVELGADFIKTPYADDFQQVTSVCYAPVVVLGGAKIGKEREALIMIKEAIGMGAAGVAIGRNIFQAENPRAMTAAIASILHDNAPVEEAVAILGEN